VKSRVLTCITAMTLFVALAIPVQLTAQQHHHYKLIDMGTFGGPQSWVLGGFEGGLGAIQNNVGAVVGAADTPDSNPNYSYPCNPFGTLSCILFGTQDPLVEHAFQFQNGALSDLEVLPGGYNSFAVSVSARTD
jgi:hypothetical protein